MTTVSLLSRPSSQTYRVTLFDDGTVRCAYQAGQFGRAFWHVTAPRHDTQDAPAHGKTEPLAEVDAVIAREDLSARERGHLRPSAEFRAFQRRYLAARGGHAELTGGPLPTLR